MALITVADLKLYLKKQTTNEDALLTLLLAEATALVVVWLGRPITAAAATYVDRAESLRAYASPIRLCFPVYPVEVASVVVKDADDVTVDAADYTVDGATGIVTADFGVAFDNGPYTLTANVGLSARADYAAIEPAINALIRDVAADLYAHRNPASTMEGAGGGVSVQYATSGTPRRTAGMLAAFRLLRVA